MITFEEYKKTEQCKNLLVKFKRKLENRGFEVKAVEDDNFYDELEDAIYAVNERRHFVPTEDKLFEDKYSGIVVRLAICSVAKMGAEGQTSHSENGIGRSYKNASEFPEDILSEIVPLGRMRDL